MSRLVGSILKGMSSITGFSIILAVAVIMAFALGIADSLFAGMITP